jgi:hypothetical protein
MTYTNHNLVDVYTLPNGERGIRAKVDIKADVIIGIYDGELRTYLLSDGHLVDRNKHKYIIQVAREGDILYALESPVDGPFEGIDYLNHSCNPNVSVRDRIVVVSSRRIDKGEPLVVDYRSWDLVPEGLACWCRPSRCYI